MNLFSFIGCLINVKHSAIKPIAEEDDLRIYKRRPSMRVMVGLSLILKRVKKVLKERKWMN
jgi:hypothetical protein